MDLKEKYHIKIQQNLEDAGCCNEMIQSCMELITQQHTAEALKILACHRVCLLEAFHTTQQQIETV